MKILTWVRDLAAEGKEECWEKKGDAIGGVSGEGEDFHPE